MILKLSRTDVTSMINYRNLRYIENNVNIRSSPEEWRPEDWPQEDWRTSTRYEQEVEPEYTTPRRIPRRDYPRATRLPPRTTSRRLNLTTGVAIVPRRIDCKHKICILI
jgi:hypothetical protein